MLRVLLDLLKGSSNISLALAVLAELKRSLTVRNMEVLWEAPWLEWFDTFLQDRGYDARSGRESGLAPLRAERASVWWSKGWVSNLIQLLASVLGVVPLPPTHRDARQGGLAG